MIPREPSTVYRNEGNLEALALLPDGAARVLDVGCGAGDNARLMTARGKKVTAVTWSREEAALASLHAEAVLVADVECDQLALDDENFDAILFSHVLEHVRNPAAVLTKLAPLLRRGGTAVIAVPNMANWRLRLRFLRGDWRREESGPLDRTHLQFWSWKTAASLLDGSPFELAGRVAGQVSVPLWPLRRLVPRVCSHIDAAVGGLCPNMFCGQVVLVAKRR